jgi:tetratricopeptide (TPR) repeat protein
MTKTRRLMVVVGAALLCHGSAVAGEPQSPSAAASPSALLERLAALRPSPAALIEPPVGFSTTTPFGDLVVIAELTAEIERRAQDGNDPEALHAFAVTEILGGRCQRAADLLRIALANAEVSRRRHDLGIAVACSDPGDPLARLEALEQLLRARGPSHSGSLTELARTIGLAIPLRSGEAPELGTRIGGMMTALLFDWAAKLETDAVAAAAIEAEIEAAIADARAAGDHTLDSLAARLDPHLAARLRDFAPQHQRYQRGDCRDAPAWAEAEGLPEALVLRRRLMAAACHLQQDRGVAEQQIEAVLTAIAGRSMRWLEARAHWTAGVARIQAGDLEGGRRAYALALDLAKQLGDPEAEAGLADRLLEIADRANPATLELAVEAAIVAATQPSPRVRLAALLALARIAAEQGYLWTAHQATTLAQSITSDWEGAPRGDVLAAHARAAGDIGRFEDADLALAEGFSTLEGSSDPAADSVRARLRLSRGKLAITRRRHDLAAADLEAASATLLASDLRSNAAAARIDLGTLYADLGRIGDAKALLDSARDLGPDATVLARIARLRSLLALEGGVPAEALEIACGTSSADATQRLIVVRDPRGPLGVLWTGPSGIGGGQVRDWRRLGALLDGFAAAARQRGPAAWGESLLAEARGLLPALPFPTSSSVEVITDPDLWAIPFEALWPALELTVVAPANHVGPPAEPIGRVVAFGQRDPDLATVSDELAAIASIWGDRASVRALDRPWVTDEATADLVHIAAHGPIPAEAQPPADARLLILNGCSTAGLARPPGYFERAWQRGAGTIATRWDVEDTLAAAIATGLHAELARGRSPARALSAARAAQRPVAGWHVDAWRLFVPASVESQRACPSLLLSIENGKNN